MVVYKTNEGIKTTTLTRNIMRNLDDHSAKTATPAAARKAVKPRSTEVEMALLVALVEAPDAVLDAVPDAPDDEAVELVELLALAAARKFSKVLLPAPGALTAMTIPEAQ